MIYIRDNDKWVGRMSGDAGAFYRVRGDTLMTH